MRTIALILATVLAALACGCGQQVQCLQAALANDSKADIEQSCAIH